MFNGMNTTQLKKNLRPLSSNLQEINAEWIVLNNVTFSEVNEGSDIIENLNVTFLAEEVGKRKKLKYHSERGIIVSRKWRPINIF